MYNLSRFFGEDFMLFLIDEPNGRLKKIFIK
jgi:hypothetical protein